MSDLLRDLYIQSVVKDIENEMNEWFHGENRRNGVIYNYYDAKDLREMKNDYRNSRKPSYVGRSIVSFGHRLRQSFQNFL
jgi:hypothetical protein